MCGAFKRFLKDKLTPKIKLGTISDEQGQLLLDTPSGLMKQRTCEGY